MNVFSSVILAVQMLAALGMIGLILIQHGKGADMGASFGGGSSGSLFGASGSANFLSRSTAALATVFFVATLALAYMSNSRPASAGSVLENAPVSAPAPAQTIPATGAPEATTGAPAAPAAEVPAAGAEGAAQIPTK
ncbi:preprotein translocase subunit SecG [Comamonas resistens]|uniref:Protein-export membrane protein SecG n=1 Tax=Comamonas resistens TaxID=3046670 RepID=A0ABY8SUP6_9BURK|nr:preprotein translocase subunit SecG [Comamonas resistens]MDL5035286.1 preprotein translocase subunit SecG [Comamonas resistens]WHS66648.1 preprotein translocase subunit SecG [Comamonas resistens]